MTTQQWIAKNYQSNYSTGYRFGSVMMSGGNLYSYGYHYPLLFRIGGKDFINVAGYSMTTSKHIGWSRSVAPDAIPVKLPASYNIDRATLVDMEGLLRSEAMRIALEMGSKKRQDTQVYRMLEDDFNRVKSNINQLIKAVVA